MKAHIKTVETKYLHHNNGKVNLLKTETIHEVTIGKDTLICRCNLRSLKKALKGYDLVCERKQTCRGVTPSQVYQ